MLNKTLKELNDDLRTVVLPVVVIIAIFAILGVAGNALVLRVYTSRYPKCNFKYFVVFLAIIDLISCVVIMPLEIFTLMHWYVFYWPSLCKLKSFCIVFTVSCSSWALLMIAVDRFRKVWKPHGKQILPELAVKLSVLVSAIAVIPATSDAILWGIQTYDLNDSDQLGVNSVVSMCEKDDKYKDTIWPTLHTIILYAATNMIVMISTLVIYILIATKLFCVAASSGQLSPLSPPVIKVTTPDKEDYNTGGGNRESALVFRFGSDIESGLSESEDMDKSPTGIRDSVGSISDVKESNTSEGIELRQVRHSNGSAGEERVKVVRLSVELLNSPKQLKPPESPSKVKVPRIQQRGMQRRRSTIGSMSGTASLRLRRKTLIMFILTAIFVGTSALYFAMISHMARTSHFVTSLSLGEATAWLFFLRLYFINSVINPILYGFLDPRFRRALWGMGVHISLFAGSLRKTLGSRIERDTPETVSLRRKRQSHSSAGGGSSH